MSKVAQAADPVLRDTRSQQDGLLGVGEAALKNVVADIPGLSQTLPARRSGTGAEITRQGTALERIISPSIVTRDKPGADFERILVDVDATPSAPRKEISVRGRNVQLTDAEYKSLQDADLKVTDRLRRVVQSPSFQRMDAEAQKRYIRRQYEDARDTARKRIRGKNDFRRRAIAELRSQ